MFLVDGPNPLQLNGIDGDVIINLNNSNECNNSNNTEILLLSSYLGLSHSVHNINSMLSLPIG